MAMGSETILEAPLSSNFQQIPTHLSTAMLVLIRGGNQGPKIRILAFHSNFGRKWMGRVARCPTHPGSPVGRFGNRFRAFYGHPR